MAAFLEPGAWGRDFAWAMENYAHMAGMWIVGEDMPQEQNGVTLHASEKDAFGLPIPNVHFDDHANDVAMRNHAFKQGSAVYEAVGARRVYETPPYPSTHNLGTCRQSAEPAGRGLQQVRPDPRHQEPVHLGRQPVHHRRRREPDADHRDARDPPGGLHRRPDEQGRDLSPPPRVSPRSGLRPGPPVFRLPAC